MALILLFALENKTLSVDSGSYTLTGTAASLEYGFEIVPDAGAYALTGTNAALEFGFETAADAGSYLLTGTAASLEFGRELVPDAGSYLLTGTSASLSKGLPLAADSGAYTLTGSTASLEFGREIVSDAGSYLLTGTAASLEFGREIVSDAGSYLLTGTDASLEYGREVAADAGSYLLTGTDATLTYTPSAVVEPTGGGWLSEAQIKAHDKDRKKRRDEQRAIEETIRLAYQRLTGKTSAAPIIEAAQGNPEKLAVQAVKLAESLASKASNSERFRARNKAIIADLMRQAAQITAQIEEEAIVILLAA